MPHEQPLPPMTTCPRERLDHLPSNRIASSRGSDVDLCLRVLGFSCSPSRRDYAAAGNALTAPRVLMNMFIFYGGRRGQRGETVARHIPDRIALTRRGERPGA